ncbi:DUF4097 family beta strand repeat-containing protein [Tumebacillus permanentifrigoris]|uniref:Putative adhesin n=1 Tax=Tumebacillus permanentifrigoris TaxID=378543 RepID=A0A316DSH1_9BACL|nr:DUF4097 family beta strand repeat-containing protein [Tumebacillus permanentifrigoris]PWK08956.1 putative adhesin [Tumebacillus permanentifrigoris]
MLKALLGLAQIKQDETKTVELTPVGAVDRLKLHVHNGRLALHEWDESYISAEVRVRVRGDEHTPMENFWSLRQTGSEVVFEQEMTHNNWFLGLHVSVDVRMNVPAEILQANLKTHNGPIEVDLFNGDLRVLTHNGAIRIADVEGMVHAHTHNGQIETLRIDGDLTLTSHNGKLEIDKVTGRLQANTHNGQIQVCDCGNSVSLTTHNGQIYAQQNQGIQNSWDLVTHNGNIQCYVPRDTDATYKLHTTSGRISGDALPVQTSGYAQKMTVTTGKGTHLIDLHTKSGNIEVRQNRAGME